MVKLARMLQERMRMLREDAAAVASVVEAAFRGQSEVDDEMLDKDVRQVFYDLQDEHILDVRREVTNARGRDERHYYWRVADYQLRGHETPPEAPDDEALVYDRLARRAWERRRPFDL